MSSPKRRRIVDSDDEDAPAGSNNMPFQEAVQSDDEDLDDPVAEEQLEELEENVDEIGANVRSQDDDNNRDEDEDPDGENLVDNWEADYADLGEFDTYDMKDGMMDNAAQKEMTFEEREAAERANAVRARRQRDMQLDEVDGDEDDFERKKRWEKLKVKEAPQIKKSGVNNISTRVAKWMYDSSDEPTGEVTLGQVTHYNKTGDTFTITYEDLDKEGLRMTEEVDREALQKKMDVLFSRNQRRRLQKSEEQQGREVYSDEEDIQEQEDFMDEVEIDLELNQLPPGMPLREFLAEEKTRVQIQRKFKQFLATYQNNADDPNPDDSNPDYGDKKKKKKKKRTKGGPLYHQRITSMCAMNLSSLEVSFVHLSEAEPQLAIWLADAPTDMLELLDNVATRYTLTLFREYKNISSEIYVRINQLPISDSLRDLRQVHLDSLIKVSGVVTRRTGVQPTLKLAKYDCMCCGYLLGPFRIDDQDKGNNGPSMCPHCQRTGPFKLNSTETLYKNFQRVTLQEKPGNVPAGRVPRSKDVILLNDLIDQCRPGEFVEITGVYRHSYDIGLSSRTGFPVFNTNIVANHVLKKEDLMAVSALSENDKQDILDLAKDPKIGERIIRSIAPSIYGMLHAKRSIAFALFGGVPKNVKGHRIRSDINCLLLGDPGVAKSQLLKYAEKTAPRAVYSTGKGASAVGLTAAVRKDPMTKEWTLEGGALVLADKGVCLIDEFDKMDEMDRTSIHEAMEQQSISISKAGIITSLQARCSVIAAANPIGGRYDSSCTLAENVELTDPILSRFDCLVVLQDVVDPVADELLAKFVVGSHMRSTPTDEQQDIGKGEGEATRMQLEDENNKNNALLNDRDEVTIPQSLLRKYIQYARTAVHPQLKGFDQDKVAQLYSELRRESASNGGLPIAVRHIESVMRMAEAHARMHLREWVREDDIDAAICTMVESFIMSQKFSVRRALEKGFRKYLVREGDKNILLLRVLNSMVREMQVYLELKKEKVDSIRVFKDEFEHKAKEMNIFELRGFYESAEFKEAEYVLDEKSECIWRKVAEQ